MFFKRKWRCEIFYNNGDGKRGRGVAILIKRGVGEKLKWFMMIKKEKV